ncbi:hypothetical protein CK203_094827 [Vitis vinifera]|uniref:DUF4283 domain-containing protein n=1 Tax=Vitis vinifera TaxID=29760 RepID=A0A438DCH0_VITVI|nr:hypothetical protein CK203_094827 [Vitis vinifera]
MGLGREEWEVFWFAVEEEFLWRKVTGVKYGQVGFGWRTKEARGTFGVGVWRDILKESSWCWDNIEFKVGKGTKVSFWTDHWCGNSVSKLFPSCLLWRPKGMPRTAVAYVEGLRISLEEDSVIWKGGGHGRFRIRDAYKLLTGPNSLSSEKEHLGDKVPTKVAFFAWEASWEKVLTLDKTSKTGCWAKVYMGEESSSLLGFLEWLAVPKGCFKGEVGGRWCSLTEHSKGSVFVLGFEKEEVYKIIRVRLQKEVNLSGKAEQGREGRILHKFAGPLQRSSANVVKEERPRRGGLVSVGRWARVVVCECHVGSVNWAEIGRAMARRLGHKGVVTVVPFTEGKGLFFVETLEEAVSLHESRFIRIKGGFTVLLRRWLPKENSEIEEKFKEVGAVTEIDWRTLKLFYLSKARSQSQWLGRKTACRLERWVSQLSIWLRHTGTVGRKREEEDRSTVGKGTSAGAVGRTMEWRGGQKAENAPGRTRGTNRTTVGNSWPPTSFSSNSKSQRASGAGPRQAGRVKAQSNLVDEIWASKHMTRAHCFSKPSPQSETDVGWKREVPGKGPIQVLGQEKEGKQDRFSKGPSHRATHSAKGKATVGYEDSENQRRGSAVKCGSKKLWNVLLPSSSACRQGDRSRREPLTTERSPPGSNTLPLEDASEAGTQLV